MLKIQGAAVEAGNQEEQQALLGADELSLGVGAWEMSRRQLTTRFLGKSEESEAPTPERPGGLLKKGPTAAWLPAWARDQPAGCCRHLSPCFSNKEITLNFF